MSEKDQAHSTEQVGMPGKAVEVGCAVGGVHSTDDPSWLDLWALSSETRASLKALGRDAACSQASSRRGGAGDGSKEITTPQKLQHLQDTLYGKAKAEPGYRFWSLYGELTRRDLLEHALRLVARNGGAPGVDGVKYFDSIPHDRLMKLVAGRTSDGSLLHLIKEWLDAPIVEESQGKKHVLPNRCGVPQGGVISPLLANLYLNALDWAVNDPQLRGQPVLVRYADDFVILCAPGQGAALRERLVRWLAPRGLKLNQEKSRVADSRDGFNFLGFTVRWQRSRQGKGYGHVEPSAKSAKRLREAVREKLNHWTLGQRTPEAMAGVNRLLRGWSGYFHYRHSTRVMSKLQWYVRCRVRRWLWRKHGCKRGLWSGYPDESLHQRYGLWPMPTHAAWKNPGAPNALQ